MPASRGPSRAAVRVLGLGAGPTVSPAWLSAVLVELGLAQRHPSVINRAPLPTRGVEEVVLATGQHSSFCVIVAVFVDRQRSLRCR